MVHSFGQPNQPFQPLQPVFPKRTEPVDGIFWFTLSSHFFKGKQCPVSRSVSRTESHGFFLGKQQEKRNEKRRGWFDNYIIMECNRWNILKIENRLSGCHQKKTITTTLQDQRITRSFWNTDTWHTMISAALSLAFWNISKSLFDTMCSIGVWVLLIATATGSLLLDNGVFLSSSQRILLLDAAVVVVDDAELDDFSFGFSFPSGVLRGLSVRVKPCKRRKKKEIIK